MGFGLVGLAACFSTLLCYLTLVSAFSNERSDNLAVYWGQDSAGHQQRLSFYCQDDTIDVIPMAFLYIFFGKGGMPVIDFANTCGQGGGRTFPGTDLVDCSFLEDDIKQCQAKGKLVTLSLGGGTSKVGIANDAQANTFAETVWNLFLGGESNTRPFGNAVLDGIDLDIESGSAAHYGTFVNKVKSLAKGAPKRYYITAAPQCPFPDAKIGEALNSAPFDAVYVQFYNNYCETSSPQEFNFATWDRWAKTQSPNPDVKVFIGVPGGAKAAGDGYVGINTLISVAKDAQENYSSFGGVMIWDADQAYTNNRYDLAIKNAISNGPRAPNKPPATTQRNTQTQVQNPSRTPKLPPSSSSSVSSTSISSMGDPRATARVKRPSFTFTFAKKDEVTAAAKPEQTMNRSPSRFFQR